MKYDIKKGVLLTDLDTPYDEENNKIDVYSSVYWTAENEENYLKKEAIINNYKIDNSLVQISAWCDISGFDYWIIKQEEENYVSIDVCLKKQPNDYTQEEIEQIRNLIIEADDYFKNQLN